jgi:glutamyl-tRNA reductase
MSIVVCGINHKTAPVVLREKVIFSSEKLALYLNDLLAHADMHEAVILSTCNRSEVYCHTDDTDQLIDWFCRQHSLSRADVEPFLYFYQDDEAVLHMMRVACGLDSMVVGESQILGQMKVAFSESCAVGAVGPLFNRLFQQIFTAAKDVRTNTTIGACPVSVASTAVSLAKQQFSDMQAATVLVIGAGDTVNLVLRHLKGHAISRLLIASRNSHHATKLAEQFDAEVVTFAKLPKALAAADIVISATSSAMPVVTQTMFQSFPAHAKQITMIDIAVPRDVDPQVGELPFVQLYCIDDLRDIIQHNKRGREHAAEKANEMIQQKSREFMTWTQSLDKVATTIRAYRKQIEDICHAELVKATRQLQRGDDPLQVLTSFSHAFTNKLLHTPSVQLRQAGFAGRLDILELVHELFAIPQIKTETL